jgi:hypothetical protein
MPICTGKNEWLHVYVKGIHRAARQGGEQPQFAARCHEV